MGSKKQHVVSRSRAIAHIVCEMVWLTNLLVERDFRQLGPMPMHCDDQFAIYITHNLVFHERIKHIKADCHFVKDAWIKKVVNFQFTPSSK